MVFVFKNIFGFPKHPRILISFLNATLKPVNKITHVEVKGTDIAKQFIEDKYSRLDFKATTNNDEIINIEIQLKNEYNMIQRSLHYLSKMYEEQLNETERKGIKKGIKQRTIELAQNLLDVLDNKTISLKTGLSIDEIEQLRNIQIN